MSRSAIIEREQRWRPWAIAAAALPIGLFVIALFARASVDVSSGGLLPAFLEAVHESPTAWLAGGVLQGLALMLMAIPLTYLFLAAAGRSERVLKPLVALCIAGPLLFGLQPLLLGIAATDIADAYAAQAEGVGDIYNLASDLFEESGLRQAATVVGIGSLLMVFAVVYTSLWALRTGLVTRFFGTLGMALGAGLLFPPLAQLALPGLFMWFGYLALLISGRSRRGRPPAWDAGEAVPWPAPGQEPAAAAPEGDVIEGDASEIPGVDESPHAARRERAKRRKRKRRQ